MAKQMADDVETPEEPTLRDQIEDARDQYVEAHEAANPEPAADKSGTESTGGRARGAGGRFVKGGDAPEASEAVASVAPSVATNGAEQQAPGTTVEPASGPLIAPNSWSQAAKAEWSTLNPSIQAEISRRETEVHKTLTRQDEERALGNQLGQVYQQNLDFFQRAQVHPIKLMNDYIGISKILGGSDVNAKAQLLFQAARQNGVDLWALARMAGAPPAGTAPPQGSTQGQPQQQFALPPDVNAALQEIRDFRAQRETEAKSHEEQQNQQAYQEIVAFRADPTHPHFDAVKDHMIALMANGQAASLKDAYEAACWGRPDIRALLQNEQNAANVASEKARIAAQKARLKGGSIAGGPGGANGAAAPDRSLRDEIAANLRAAQSQRA